MLTPAVGPLSLAPCRVIGAVGVPDLSMVTCSLYVPVTRIVWPADTAATAASIVQYGWLWVPAPASEQLSPTVLLTYNMVVSAEATEPDTRTPAAAITAASPTS